MTSPNIHIHHQPKMPFHSVPSVFGLYHHKAAYFFPKYIPRGIVSLRQTVYRLLCVLVFEICMCRLKFFVCYCECISECFLLSVCVSVCWLSLFHPSVFFDLTECDRSLNIDLWLCVRMLVFIVLFVNESQPEGV